MKTAITIILGISLLLYTSGLTITTNPFRISLPDWEKGVSLIFFALALFFNNISEHRKGYEEGKEEQIDFIYSKMKETELKK